MMRFTSPSRVATLAQAVRFVRGWLFSPLGTLVAWQLLLLAAGGAWIMLMDEQNEVTQNLVFVLGCWWLADVVVIQCLIPQGTDSDRLQEGLAAAGWQCTLAVVLTGVIVWQVFFEDGTYQNLGLAGVWAALGGWLLSSIGSGLLVIWLRGHSIEETVLYGLFATVAGLLWMSIGVVIALPGT